MVTTHLLNLVSILKQAVVSESTNTSKLVADHLASICVHAHPTTLSITKRGNGSEQVSVAAQITASRTFCKASRIRYKRAYRLILGMCGSHVMIPLILTHRPED